MLPVSCSQGCQFVSDVPLYLGTSLLVGFVATKTEVLARCRLASASAARLVVDLTVMLCAPGTVRNLICVER